MKSSLAITSLCVTLAIAGPVKRAMVTDWVYETVTVTVTGDVDVPSSTPAAQFYTKSEWETWAPADPTTTTTSSTTPAAVVIPVTPSIESAWVEWTTAAPVVPAPAPTSAPAPSSSNSDGLDSYAKPILDQHNFHRANHSAPAMSWDSDLASIAQQIANTCVYDHNTAIGGGGYGQNIGAGAPPEDAPKMITNDMYNGEVNYYPGYGGEPDMSDFENWGHFSQIIWADSTSVGCATAYCPGGLANAGDGISPYFTVCNYKPAGNFGGRYGANVLAPIGDATVFA